MFNVADLIPAPLVGAITIPASMFAQSEIGLGKSVITEWGIAGMLGFIAYQLWQMVQSKDKKLAEQYDMRIESLKETIANMELKIDRLARKNETLSASIQVDEL